MSTIVQYSLETGFLCSRTAAAEVQRRYTEGDDQSGEEQNRNIAITTGHVAQILALSRNAELLAPWERSCCRLTAVY